MHCTVQALQTCMHDGVNVFTASLIVNAVNSTCNARLQGEESDRVLL